MPQIAVPFPQGIHDMADPAVWIWCTVTISGCAALLAASVARWRIAKQLHDLRLRVEAIERRR